MCLLPGDGVYVSGKRKRWLFLSHRHTNWEVMYGESCCRVPPPCVSPAPALQQPLQPVFIKRDTGALNRHYLLGDKKKKLASPDHPLLPPTTWEGAILGTFIQIRARVQQQSTQREEQHPQTATSVGTHSQSAYKSSVYCSGWVDLSINWSTGKESGYTLITVWWLKSIYAPTAFMWCSFSSFCPKSAEIHSHKANNSD